MSFLKQLLSPLEGKDVQDPACVKIFKQGKDLNHQATHHSSTHSSSNSFHLASSNSSPKSSASIINFNFSENLTATDEVQSTGRTSVNKVKNFEKTYLDVGLWPEIEDKDQARIKGELRKVKSELNCKKGKIAELKKEIIRNRESCVSCAEWKKKNENTQAALKQAIDLSNMLLLEMKKIGN